MVELDPVFRDIAVLFGLLGPTGLIGYVWRSAVWKTRLEDRLCRLEERDREFKRELQRIEPSISDATRDASVKIDELNRTLNREIRRLDEIVSGREV